MNNDELVDRVVERGFLKTKRIIEAFRKVDRKEFVLPRHVKHAYADDALPHLAGQTIPQPSTVAVMLELLQPNGVALDVGTGSGYTAALLSRLCKGVHTVERIHSLAEFANERLKKLKNVKTHLGDGSRGLRGMQWDCILVTAEASQIPKELKEQLKEGGKIVMPVDGSLVLGRRNGEFSIVKEVWGFAFVPLREGV
ncbi:methyltransferase domain-containing protein [Candidatus Bathyarchaeota archaeon]|nr:methyltransferase domain-containing protein [Candidatus Bathyarchaeota archaeon]